MRARKRVNATMRTRGRTFTGTQTWRNNYDQYLKSKKFQRDIVKVRRRSTRTQFVEA